MAARPASDAMGAAATRSSSADHRLPTGGAPASHTASYRRSSRRSLSQAARSVVTVRPSRSDIASLTGATTCHGTATGASKFGRVPSRRTRIESSSGRRIATDTLARAGLNACRCLLRAGPGWVVGRVYVANLRQARYIDRGSPSPIQRLRRIARCPPGPCFSLAPRRGHSCSKVTRLDPTGPCAVRCARAGRSTT